MNIWERHAARERKRAQLERADKWLLAHPGKSYVIALGAGLIFFLITKLLELGLDAIAKHFQH